MHALELTFTLLVASVIYCLSPLSSKTALNVIINLCAKVVKCEPDKFCFRGKDASNDNTQDHFTMLGLKLNSNKSSFNTARVELVQQTARVHSKVYIC